MDIQRDYVRLNLSNAQRRIVRDPNYSPLIASASYENGRLRIQVDDFSLVENGLQQIERRIETDPEYEAGSPTEVVRRIKKRLFDAREAHMRAYGT